MPRPALGRDIVILPTWIASWLQPPADADHDD
jgi:hypothetical protein